MRYFFSTGEPSGELSAVLLARASGEIDPSARFEGIGADRMRANGFDVWHDTAGWASIGPLAAIPRIPPLLVAMLRTASRLARTEPDLIVLVDFGAFNLRLASLVRAFGSATKATAAARCQAARAQITICIRVQWPYSRENHWRKGSKACGCLAGSLGQLC